MTAISKSQLAMSLGVTKQRVSQYVKGGMPCRPDGQLDYEAAIRWIADHHPAAIEADRGATRATKLAAQLRQKNPRSNVPPGYEVIAGEKSPFAQGMLVASKEIVARVGALAAVLSVECGANCSTAFALESAVTLAVMMDVSGMLHRLGIGPFADTPQALFGKTPARRRLIGLMLRAWPAKPSTSRGGRSTHARCLSRRKKRV